MAQAGERLLSEILSQPAVWATVLERFKRQASALGQIWQALTPQQVIFTGCGSAYFAAASLAPLLRLLLGISAQAHPASELVLSPSSVFTPYAKSLLVALSRSGETTETIEAARMFRRRTGGRVVVITCSEQSTLAQLGDLNLLAPEANDESVIQTRSLSSLILLGQALIAQVGVRNAYSELASIAAACERLLHHYHRLAQELGESSKVDSFFFLGLGCLHGIAGEAMLKMKEMSLARSEVFQTLEFRHGLMANINERSLIVGLLSDDALRHEIRVLQEMHEGMGAHILALSESGSGLPTSDRIYELRLHSGMPFWARPVLYLPVLQLMAYYRAIANGKNPDQPENLRAFVSLASLSKYHNA